MLVSVILSLFPLIVTLTHSKPNAALEKEIVFQCGAGWPSSRSRELSPWEIQAWEDRNQPGSPARRDLVETAIAHWPWDTSHAKFVAGGNSAVALSSSQTQKSPSEYSNRTPWTPCRLGIHHRRFRIKITSTTPRDANLFHAPKLLLAIIPLIRVLLEAQQWKPAIPVAGMEEGTVLLSCNGQE